MCHFIFVCKDRKNLLTIYGDEIKSIFFDISNEKNFTILDIVRHLRQISTYRIGRQNNNHVYVQKHFWKERTFWSAGYFACRIGNVCKDIIEKYIQEQG